MGYYLKADGEFVGPYHRKVLSKEFAKFFIHPSACAVTARKMYEKDLGKVFKLYKWSKDTCVENYEFE